MRLRSLAVAAAAAICALTLASAGQPTQCGNPSDFPLVMKPRSDMQLDHVQGVYYKHVMKTGGSTLDEMLWLATKNRSMEFRTSESPKTPLLSTNLFPAFIKIVTLREPISRVISHYWQVKPWGNYSGGSDRICRLAAALHYDPYLLRCNYARNWQSRYFSATMLRGTSVERFLREAFDLVILSEVFDAGAVVLHYKFGFSVYDLLYMFRKVRQPRPLHLSNEQKQRTIASNLRDVRLYEEAQKVWGETMREVRDMDRFQHAVKNYRQLVHVYNEYMRSLATQKFAVEARRDPEKLQKLVRLKNAFCETHPQCRFNNLLLGT